MQDYQAKYQEEKNKYDNLLKMQKTILADNDEYIAALHTIKRALADVQGNQFDEDEEVTPEQSKELALKVASAITAKQKQCDCERWRSLYQQQCKDFARLTQQKQQLMNKLINKEKEEQMDRVEINKLLNDYLDLYKKQLNPEQRKSQKKEGRSKSKGKSNHSQTQRKPNKNITLEKQENGYVKTTLERLQRDLFALQQEVVELRTAMIEKEQIIKLYRTKQWKHLLAGGQLLD